MAGRLIHNDDMRGREARAEQGFEPAVKHLGIARTFLRESVEPLTPTAYHHCGDELYQYFWAWLYKCGARKGVSRKALSPYSRCYQLQRKRGRISPLYREIIRLCRKVDSNILLSIIGGIFDIPSFHHVVWFVHFATEPLSLLRSVYARSFRLLAVYHG
jgi:hypothetical protein